MAFEVKFQNGKTATFQNRPTDADIDEVAKSIGASAGPAAEPKKESGGLLQTLKNLRGGAVDAIAAPGRTLQSVLPKQLTTLPDFSKKTLGTTGNEAGRTARLENLGAEPEATSTKAGEIAGEIATFAAPGAGITKVGKGVQALVRGADAAPGIARRIAGLGARAATEGAGFGAVEAARTGEVGQNEAEIAFISSAFPLAGKAIQAGRQLTLPAQKQFAEKMINSLIKPGKNSFAFGKEPGRGVAREGIKARSLEELATNIDNKLNQIGGEISNKLKASIETIDLTQSLKPISEALEQANKAPSSNSAIINRLQGSLDDLLDVKTLEDGTRIPQRNLQNLSPQEAFEFKQIVSDITKFTGNASDDAMANKALIKVYGNIKGEINNKVPGVKQLNERYADLISASKAAKNRQAVIQSSNIVPFTESAIGAGAAISAIATGGITAPLLIGVGAVGLRRALSTPKVKTGLAAWLAKTPKAEQEKLYRQVPWARSIFNSVLNTQESPENSED